MEWTTYLNEIRARLISSLALITILFFVCLICSDELYGLLASPLMTLFPTTSHLIATHVTSPIIAPIKLSFYIALLCSIPFIIWQIWSFAAPALYPHEKKASQVLLMVSTILFYTGLTFAYFIVLPMIILTATHYGPDSMIMLPEIYQLLNFSIELLFMFGMVFELPILIVILNQCNVLPSDVLKDNRRATIVVAFTVAMILTPPDVISQIMMALPIILLTELGIYGCHIIEKNNQAATT